MLQQLLRSKPGGRFIEFMRSDRGKAFDRFLVRTTGFSLLMRVFSARGGFPPMPVLMLHTIGRRSGQERATVMPYIEMDGSIYLIGSNGAKSRDPFWVDNLRARPEATIDVRRVRRRVRARIVEQDSDEKRQLWAVAATKTPQYATYQRATSRPIPVVALEDANSVVRFDI